MDPIFYQGLDYFLIIVGSILGLEGVPKRGPKINQKWNLIWNRLLWHSEVEQLPKPAFCEAVGKVPGCLKYTQRKKGRDKALKNLIRPLKAL